MRHPNLIAFTHLLTIPTALVEQFEVLRFHMAMTAHPLPIF